MKKNKSRGFTIIELLVVIAIIAVLASIVLVNVTQYINKSKDAAIKGNMSTILTNAAVYIDTPANSGKYATSNGASNGFCSTASTNPLYANPVAAITSAGGTVSQYCTDSTFCSCSPLKSDSSKTFCVDSTGYRKETGATCVNRCSSSINTCID